MSLELEGWNFEAYPHFRLTISGFVSVTGEGNLGKSTIVRFLRAVLFNEFDLLRIRRGAKEAVCRINFVGEPGDVVRVERKKSARSNSYEITMRDGTVHLFGDAGNNIPRHLDEMGFSLLRPESGDEHNLNFHRQMKDPLFLLGNTSVQLAAFLHHVFHLDSDEGALRDLNADAMGNRQAHDKRGKEIIRIHTRLSKAADHLAGIQTDLDALQAARQTVADAERERDAVQARLVQCRRLEQLGAEREAETARWQALQEIRQHLLRLQKHLQRQGQLARSTAELRRAAESRAISAHRLTGLQQALPVWETALTAFRQAGKSRQLLSRWQGVRLAVVTAQAQALALGKGQPRMALALAALKQHNRTARHLRRWQTLRQDSANAQAWHSASQSVETVLRATLTLIKRHLTLRLHRYTLACADQAHRRSSALLERLAQSAAPVQQLVVVLRRQAHSRTALSRLQAAAAARTTAKQRWSDLSVGLKTLCQCDTDIRRELGHCPVCHGVLTTSHRSGGSHAAHK